MTTFDVFKALGLSVSPRPLYRTSNLVTFCATFVDKEFTVEVPADVMEQTNAAQVHRKAEEMAVATLQKALAKMLLM